MTRARRPIPVSAWLMLGYVALALPAAGAPEIPDLVRQAIEKTSGEPPEGWGYTETAVRNGRRIVHTFDPRRPEGERWHLVSVDGRPPTEEERRDNAEERSSGGDPGEDDEDPIEEMIKPGSLRLVEDSADRALYRFEPVSEDEDDAKIYENLDATLAIVKNGPYVESVDMRSRGPFKPAFAVKISEFVLTRTFEPVEPGGPAFPRSATVKLSGRALIFKKITENVEITYSDYTHAEKE